jgi:GT2 family glycosyltransferase
VAVRVVVATTLPEEKFWADSYLGRSLSVLPKALQPQTSVVADNTGEQVRGLPAVYNEALDQAADDDVLVFAHDDVFVHDWFLVRRAREAARRWDVAGVAGAVEPDLAQPSWYWTFDEAMNKGPRQDRRRSGAINHSALDGPKIEVFGATPARCALLDGVLLVVNVGKVRAAAVRFDERFTFHMYDLDFSRSAVAAGLAVGTWPIAVTHGSAGGWSSESFTTAARLYLDKWSRQRAAAPGPRRSWWRR